MLKIPNATPLDINTHVLPYYPWIIVTELQGVQESLRPYSTLTPIHSFIKHVLSVYCILGSFLGAGIIALNKTGQVFASVELYSWRYGADGQEKQNKTQKTL